MELPRAGWRRVFPRSFSSSFQPLPSFRPAAPEVFRPPGFRRGRRSVGLGPGSAGQSPTALTSWRPKRGRGAVDGPTLCRTTDGDRGDQQDRRDEGDDEREEGDDIGERERDRDGTAVQMRAIREEAERAIALRDEVRRMRSSLIACVSSPDSTV